MFDSDRNLYIPIYGEVNSARAPMHHQLDLRDRSTRGSSAPMRLTAFLDVQNVYMNESVVDVLLQLRLHAAAAFKSLPIIPSIGLRGVL